MDVQAQSVTKAKLHVNFTDKRVQKLFLLVLVSSFENVKSSNNIIKHNVCVYIYIHMKSLRDKKLAFTAWFKQKWICRFHKKIKDKTNT